MEKGKGLKKHFAVFAFGRSYEVLFFARALQGIGSSCSSVSGLDTIVECFFSMESVTIYNLLPMSRNGNVGGQIH